MERERTIIPYSQNPHENWLIQLIEPPDGNNIDDTPAILLEDVDPVVYYIVYELGNERLRFLGINPNIADSISLSILKGTLPLGCSNLDELASRVRDMMILDRYPNALEDYSAKAREVLNNR